jgi:signal transduction histidine kinase
VLDDPNRWVRAGTSLLVTATVCGWSALSALRTPMDTFDDVGSVPQPDAVVLPVLVMVTVAAVLRRRVPAALVFAAAVGWLTCSMWPALPVAGYTIGTRLRRRGPRVAAGAGLTAVVAAPVFLGLASFNGVAVAFAGAAAAGAALVWLPLLLGAGHVARTELAGQLARQLAEREAERRRTAEAAQRRERQVRDDRAQEQERARIAREMHDIVAHRVSLMVLHAGALEVATTDQDAVPTLGLIRETGRDALTELRHVLGVLRTGQGGLELAPQPTVADLDRLVAEFRAAGLRVTSDGSLGQVPATVGRAAYRVVQEALTNVVKHAGSAPTAVTLGGDGDAWEVTVHNEPAKHPVGAPPPGGHGLVGLRERVHLLEGHLETGGTAAGGFQVRARFFKHGTEARAHG